MPTLTITEALAEKKTIDKRIESESGFVGNYLYRQDTMRDPLEKEGGSATAIERKRQSITDLQTRKLAISRAIRRANEKIEIMVAGETRSVADWLVWRREVAPSVRQMLKSMNDKIQGMRADALRKGLQVVGDGKSAGTATDVVVNISEGKLAQELEHIEAVLGQLDGLLSLKNATVEIDIPD